MTDTTTSFTDNVSKRYGLYIRLRLGDIYTWMRNVVPGGDGELKSESQGRSRDSSFAQETGEKIQSQSRIDGVPSLLGKVQDARRFFAHLPSFFLFQFIQYEI